MRFPLSFRAVTLIVLVGLALHSGNAASAAVITVTSTSGGTGGPDCTLRDAITAANTDAPTGGCPAGSGADVIELAPGATYTLTEVDNLVDGGNGLPWLISTITINGHGAIIERSSAGGTPAFRFTVVVSDGALTLNELTLRNGRAERPGGSTCGGAIIMSAGTLKIFNSTVSGNSSAHHGGGICVKRGLFELVNSTVSDNSAVFYGGGIYFTASSGASSLVNSTITENSTGTDGGGIWYFRDFMSTFTVTLVNTIVANQQAGEDCWLGGTTGGWFTSLGHNLDSDGTCITDGVNNDITDDPLLGPLQCNGGPPETHALLTHSLLEGSPAVDAGDDTVCASAPVNGRDQRGVIRPQGAACDIGAFELAEGQEDFDGDGILDGCDNCPDDPNGPLGGPDNQVDTDGDGAGDVCDPCPNDNPDDTDGDGVCDSDDLCPGFDDTVDTDGDGVPDGCDPDIDGDEVPNELDVCDFTPLGAAVDSEGRPLGDNDSDCDTDLEDYALLQLGMTGPHP